MKLPVARIQKNCIFYGYGPLYSLVDFYSDHTKNFQKIKLIFSQFSMKHMEKIPNLRNGKTLNMKNFDLSSAPYYIYINHQVILCHTEITYQLSPTFSLSVFLKNHKIVELKSLKFSKWLLGSPLGKALFDYWSGNFAMSGINATETKCREAMLPLPLIGIVRYVLPQNVSHLPKQASRSARFLKHFHNSLILKLFKSKNEYVLVNRYW